MDLDICIPSLTTQGVLRQVGDVRAIKTTRGFSGIPITESGKIGSKILGMVCTRDIDFVGDDSLPVTEVMTRDLIVAKEGCTLSQVHTYAHTHTHTHDARSHRRQGGVHLPAGTPTHTHTHTHTHTAGE